MLPAAGPASDAGSLASRTKVPGSKRQRGDVPAGAVVQTLVIADGRLCRFCGIADTAEDPVDLFLGRSRSDGKVVTYAWYLDKTEHQQKNTGLVCFYCYAVYGARYKHRGLSLAAALEEIGMSQDTMTRFKGFREAVIQSSKDSGGRGGRMQWTQLEQKSLTFTQVASVAYEEPIDEHWGYNEYLSEKGDPLTNGLRHEVKEVNGNKVVVVPGRKIWRVRRKTEQNMIVKQKIDNGSADLTANQIDEYAHEMRALFDRFMPVCMSGEKGHDSLSSLLRSTKASPSSSSFPSQASSAIVPSSSSAAASGSDDSFGVVERLPVSFGFSSLNIASVVPPAPPAMQASDADAGESFPVGTGGARKRLRFGGVPRKPAPPPPEPGVGACTDAREQPGSGQKKPGRPKRDLNIAVDEICKEWEAIEEGSAQYTAWYGDEFKSNRRTLMRLCGDVTKQVSSTSDLAEYAVLVAQKKRLEAMLIVLDFCNKSGVTNAGLADLVKEQKHFLSLEPAAVLRFPKYIETNAFLLTVRASRGAASFWEGVKEAENVFVGEVAMKKQSSVIAERIIAITKSSEISNLMTSFFPQDS